MVEKTKHLSNPELQAFLTRELPSAQMLDANDHLAECAECRSALEKQAGAGKAVQQLESAFARREPHLEYEQVKLLAEGKSVSPEAAQHAAACDACAREVAELRTLGVVPGTLRDENGVSRPVH